jgi:predicted amidohydrolase
MAIPLWRAHCMQVATSSVNRVRSRQEAMAIVSGQLDRWEELIDEAATGRGNQVLLFPEFALTGFPLKEAAAEWIEKACIEIPGPETARLSAKARQHNMYIGANSYERDPEWPGRYFNCSYLIDPAGEVVLKYRRINSVQAGSPHDFMDKYLARYGVEGTFPVARTPLGNIAMMPCGEIMYPEASRVFMLRGAEVLLHPTSDLGTFDRMGWESCKIARASENMMYLVSANSTGTKGGPSAQDNTMGNSKIIDYDGRVLIATGGPGETTRCAATIDVEALRRARRGIGGDNRVLRQRLEIYQPVYAAASLYPPNSFAEAPMDSKARILEVQQRALANLEAAGILPAPERATA